MLYSRGQVKEPLRVEDPLTHFIVTRCEKFIGMTFTLKLAFKKLLFVEFGCGLPEYPELPKKAVELLLHFLTTDLGKVLLFRILQPK